MGRGVRAANGRREVGLVKFKGSALEGILTDITIEIPLTHGKQNEFQT